MGNINIPQSWNVFWELIHQESFINYSKFLEWNTFLPGATDFPNTGIPSQGKTPGSDLKLWNFQPQSKRSFLAWSSQSNPGFVALIPENIPHFRQGKGFFLLGDVEVLGHIQWICGIWDWHKEHIYFYGDIYNLATGREGERQEKPPRLGDHLNPTVLG